MIYKIFSISSIISIKYKLNKLTDFINLSHWKTNNTTVGRIKTGEEFLDKCSFGQGQGMLNPEINWPYNNSPQFKMKTILRGWVQISTFYQIQITELWS